MEVNEENVEKIKKVLERMVNFINLYQFRVESYVIEFFVEDHWSKLPKSWQDYLEEMHPPQMATFFYDQKYTKVPPLSLLAFTKCCKTLSIPRLKKPQNPSHDQTTEHDKEIRKRIFQKHVSTKKRHEIEELSLVISKLCKRSTCNHVLDIGAGRGHLSRYLSLGHELHVSTIEMQKQLVECAVQYDLDAKQWLQKINNKIVNQGGGEPMTFNTPQHNVGKVNAFPEADNLSTIIETQSKDDNPKVLLTGLHACGDLSTTLFRKFVESQLINTIVSVSCCYMKLSNHGYPLSAYLKSVANHKLKYKTREISCHAIEAFEKVLKENGDHLKMHTYRAVLEVIIKMHFPDNSQERIQVGKKAYLLSFQDYAKKAFISMGKDLPIIDYDQVDRLLAKWHNVVTYYNITQMISPVIESTILLDRMVFLYEQGYPSKCEVLFDPVLSPRCFGIIATKN